MWQLSVDLAATPITDLLLREYFGQLWRGGGAFVEWIVADGVTFLVCLVAEEVRGGLHLKAEREERVIVEAVGFVYSWVHDGCVGFKEVEGLVLEDVGDNDFNEEDAVVGVSVAADWVDLEVVEGSGFRM
jgi:hypothetical protein